MVFEQLCEKLGFPVRLKIMRPELVDVSDFEHFTKTF